MNEVVNKISNSEYDNLITNSFKNNNIKEKTIITGKNTVKMILLQLMWFKK